jgi:hypothetical protein
MKSKDIDIEKQLNLDFNVDSDVSRYVAEQSNFVEKSFSKAEVIHIFKKQSSSPSRSQSSALRRILDKAEKISW